MTAISVLVAAYNAASTLPQCLDSLCRQTLQDIEVLCVDDCSTDGTLALLQDYASRDPRIHVFQTPVNSGQAVARNLALQYVTSPYVCMVDADDWLSKDCLMSAVTTLNTHPQTDCVLFHLIQHTVESGQEEEYALPVPLQNGSAIRGMEAFELCLDGWRLHGLYATRTTLHRRYPFDASTRLYSDDNTACLHYLHSREVRACDGCYYYRKWTSSLTNVEHFHIHRFDFMEANLSLLMSLKKEAIPISLLRRFEGHRWLTFIACYRLFLQHRHELTPLEVESLRPRFRTILHTFRPTLLPLHDRWKPGYLLTSNICFFDLQQRLYLVLKNIIMFARTR